MFLCLFSTSVVHVKTVADPAAPDGQASFLSLSLSDSTCCLSIGVYDSVALTIRSLSFSKCDEIIYARNIDCRIAANATADFSPILLKGENPFLFLLISRLSKSKERETPQQFSFFSSRFRKSPRRRDVSIARPTISGLDRRARLRLSVLHSVTNSFPDPIPPLATTTESFSRAVFSFFLAPWCNSSDFTVLALFFPPP